MMSELKFTPGPWVAETNQWGETSVKSANAPDLAEWPVEYFIAEKVGGHIRGEDFTDFSEVRANAKLIAVAPDMYQALKVARRELHACQAVIHLAGGFDTAYVNDAQRALMGIDAILAKATA